MSTAANPALRTSPEPGSLDRPLRGLRIVSVEQAVAGPLCTRHLADLGATVVKIERPDGGDFSRGYDTFVHGESTYFSWLNRGKRSVVLDLSSSPGMARLTDLLDSADVFVSNLGPGSLDRLGLAPSSLRARWPALVSCRISGYGQGGPHDHRKAFDLLVQGEAAMFEVTGSPEERAKVGVPVADLSAAMYALSAILAALLQRQGTGRGTDIEIAMLDCLAEWMTPAVYHRIYGGREPARRGTKHDTICPYGVYAIKAHHGGDGGSVNLAVQNASQWTRFCDGVLHRPELADDPRFRSNELRMAHREQLDALIEEVLAGQDIGEVIDALDRSDIPWGHVNDVIALCRHPQLGARQRWMEVDSPTGPVLAVRSPFEPAGSHARGGAIPGLGQHNGEQPWPVDDNAVDRPPAASDVAQEHTARSVRD